MKKILASTRHFRPSSFSAHRTLPFAFPKPSSSFLSRGPSLSLSLSLSPSVSLGRQATSTRPVALEQSPSSRVSPLEKEQDIRCSANLLRRERSNSPLLPQPLHFRGPPKTSPKTAPSVLYRSAGRGARPASGGRPSVSLEKRKKYSKKTRWFGGKQADSSDAKNQRPFQSRTPPFEYLLRTRSARAFNLRS